MTVVHVHLTENARNELRKMARKRPHAVVSIQKAIEMAETMSWEDSLKVERIKVLEPQVAELRDMRGAYRLIGFWHDTGAVREFRITHVAKKGILTQSRLKVYRTAAKVQRASWIKSQGE